MWLLIHALMTSNHRKQKEGTRAQLDPGLDTHQSYKSNNMTQFLWSKKQIDEIITLMPPTIIFPSGLAIGHGSHYPGPLFTTSYRKISGSIETARNEFRLFRSLCNLTGTSAVALLKCLSSFKAIRSLEHPIPRLGYCTRFDGKMTDGLVNSEAMVLNKHRIHPSNHAHCSSFLCPFY